MVSTTSHAWDGSRPLRLVLDTAALRRQCRDAPAPPNPGHDSSSTWRTARRTFFSLALFATLLVLFYAEENWRGQRAWEKCKHALEAQREMLDWSAYIPPPIADDQNILKAPKMTEWFVRPNAEQDPNNELGAKLNYGGMSSFMHRRPSVAVAEVTVVHEKAAVDLASADLVLRLRGRWVFLAPTNLTTLPAAESEPKMPLINIGGVPLSRAIADLAYQASLKVELDPRVLSLWHGPVPHADEPSVSVRWENTSAREGLFQLLDQHALLLIENPQTGIGRITMAGPSDAQLRVDVAAHDRGRELLRQSLARGADASAIPSADAPQGFKLIAATPTNVNPLQVVVLASGKLPDDFFQVVFGQNAGDRAGNNRDRWYAESVGNNHFRLFSGSSAVYSAADYLAWSDRLVPEFDLIRDALKRPQIQLEGNFQRPIEMPVVNFTTLRFLAQTLATRAQCCLLLGQSEQALRELSLLYDARRFLRAEPTTFTAGMMEVAFTGLYVGTVADGFRLHTWREPELVALQRQLQQINLPRVMADALRSERAAICQTFQAVTAREIAETYRFMFAHEHVRHPLKNPGYLLLRYAPRGWIFQNLAAFAAVEQTDIELFNSTTQFIDPDKVRKTKRIGETPADAWNPVTGLLDSFLPNFARGVQSLTRNQTQVNQALIACGLERYYLAHGDYPEKLDALVSQCVEKLPPDLIGGEPLHYRRTSDGQFILYSVGWNGKDDGGKSLIRYDYWADLDSPDWVWPMPAR